jgi:hypothetical protein
MKDLTLAPEEQRHMVAMDLALRRAGLGVQLLTVDQLIVDAAKIDKFLDSGDAAQEGIKTHG